MTDLKQKLRELLGIQKDYDNLLSEITNLRKQVNMNNKIAKTFLENYDIKVGIDHHMMRTDSNIVIMGKIGSKEFVRMFSVDLKSMSELLELTHYIENQYGVKQADIRFDSFMHRDIIFRE